MKENDIHRLIEEQDRENKDALYEKLQSRLNISAEQKAEQPKRRTKRTVGIFSIAAACVCVVFLAVMLPFLLKNGKVDEPGERYCSEDDYTLSDSKQTVKEYVSSTEKDILYIDWYEFSEVTTFIYVSVKDPDDMVYMREKLVNNETGDVINFYITDNRTNIDVIASFKNACEDDYNTHNTAVKYNYNNKKSMAMFEYKGFRYYIELLEPFEENSIKEIIDGMFI